MQTSIITFDGKLDNLVGFKNNKGTYSLRKRITPANPQTEKQVVARARFKALSICAQDFSKALFGLTKFTKTNRITPRNSFMKLNYPLVKGVDPTPDGLIAAEIIRWEDLILSHGNADNVEFSSIDVSKPGSVTIPFSNPYQLPSDTPVYIVAYIPALNKTFIASSSISYAAVVLEVPPIASGEEIYVFGFTQTFLDEQTRLDYGIALNEGVVCEVLGKATAMNSNFSPTHFVGKATLG